MRLTPENEYIPVECIVKLMTQRALLLIIDGEERWVPMSCVHEDDLADIDVGVISEVNIAAWFADKEGIA